MLLSVGQFCFRAFMCKVENTKQHFYGFILYLSSGFVNGEGNDSKCHWAAALVCQLDSGIWWAALTIWMENAGQESRVLCSHVGLPAGCDGPLVLHFGLYVWHSVCN